MRPYRTQKFKAKDEFRTMASIGEFFKIPLPDLFKLKVPTYFQLKSFYIDEVKRSKKGGKNRNRYRR